MKLPQVQVVKPSSPDRLEKLSATLRELEMNYSNPHHPGITHVKWLIAKYLASIDAEKKQP